jgi:type I restriction enzyme M protein
MSLSSIIGSVVDLLRGDYKQSEYGKVITVNRHLDVFKPPRPLEEIDAGLKDVTAKIMTMLEGLAE